MEDPSSFDGLRGRTAYDLSTDRLRGRTAYDLSTDRLRGRTARHEKLFEAFVVVVNVLVKLLCGMSDGGSVGG